MRTIEDQSFLLLLVLVSVAFAWILSPYYQSALWALIFAIMFAPLNRGILRLMSARPTAAALISVLIIAVIVIVPVLLIASSIAQDASGIYDAIHRVKSTSEECSSRLSRFCPTGRAICWTVSECPT